MARSASSFARGKPRYKPQPRVLVLCEDTKSCLDYLKDAARHFRAYAEIEIAHCGRTDPKGIVEEAIKRRRHLDRVYCAIDRDSHESFDAALKTAHAGGVQVIASHPCYEFWLLLHFRFSRAPYMRAGELSAADRLVHKLRNEPGMDEYAKGETRQLFDSLLDRLPSARERGARALAEAVVDGELNPSTTLHELIAAFEALGKPQPLG